MASTNATKFATDATKFVAAFLKAHGVPPSSTAMVYAEANAASMALITLARNYFKENTKVALFNYKRKKSDPAQFQTFADYVRGMGLHCKTTTLNVPETDSIVGEFKWRTKEQIRLLQSFESSYLISIESREELWLRVAEAYFDNTMDSFCQGVVRLRASNDLTLKHIVVSLFTQKQLEILAPDLNYNNNATFSIPPKKVTQQLAIQQALFKFPALVRSFQLLTQHLQVHTHTLQSLAWSVLVKNVETDDVHRFAKIKIKKDRKVLRWISHDIVAITVVRTVIAWITNVGVRLSLSEYAFILKQLRSPGPNPRHFTFHGCMFSRIETGWLVNLSLKGETTAPVPLLFDWAIDWCHYTFHLRGPTSPPSSSSSSPDHLVSSLTRFDQIFPASEILPQQHEQQPPHLPKLYVGSYADFPKEKIPLETRQLLYEIIDSKYYTIRRTIPVIYELKNNDMIFVAAPTVKVFQSHDAFSAIQISFPPDIRYYCLSIWGYSLFNKNLVSTLDKKTPLEKSHPGLTFEKFFGFT